jgi:hypothetical protein
MIAPSDIKVRLPQVYEFQLPGNVRVYTAAGSLETRTRELEGDERRLRSGYGG